MLEIIIYITCGVIVGLSFFLVFKKKDSGDSSVLSTQLSELSRRFTVLEEAAKNMGNMQSSIEDFPKKLNMTYKIHDAQ